MNETSTPLTTGFSPHDELAGGTPLLEAVPESRDGKSAWLRALAHDEQITLYLVRLLGAQVTEVGQPFRCVLHQDCLATLTRGRNGEIVYHDGHLAGTRREFQTIPELAVALRTGVPKRLTAIQHALWRIRLLHDAGLIELAPTSVPPVAASSPQQVYRAREGFELLVRCRWFLDPGEPVPYTRAFAEVWSGLSKNESRNAIYALIQQDVIRKEGEAPSGYKHPTALYLPGVTPKQTRAGTV